MATQVNDSNFDAVVLQSQLPVLVDFFNGERFYNM